jgi:DNA-binding transcriptional LysR family regulator
VTPAYVQHMSQIHSMLALVRAGLGAALVPEAATNLRLDDVHFRALDQATRPVELYAAWRRDNENPALRPFIDLCEAQALEAGV